MRASESCAHRRSTHSRTCCTSPGLASTTPLIARTTFRDTPLAKAACMFSGWPCICACTIEAPRLVSVSAESAQAVAWPHLDLRHRRRSAAHKQTSVFRVLCRVWTVDGTRIHLGCDRARTGIINLRVDGQHNRSTLPMGLGARGSPNYRRHGGKKLLQHQGRIGRAKTTMSPHRMQGWSEAKQRGLLKGAPDHPRALPRCSCVAGIPRSQVPKVVNRPA